MKTNECIAIGKDGIRYRYATKISWGVKYYSCEMNRLASAMWFRTLSDAKSVAVARGSLVRVEMTKPELIPAVQMLEDAAAFIRSEVDRINDLPGDMTEDEQLLRSSLWDAVEIIECAKSEVNCEIYASYRNVA